VNLLSARHMSRQAWLILAKFQARNRLLLHKVTNNMKPEPTTFRTSMTRKLFREDTARRVPFIQSRSLCIEEPVDVPAVSLAKLNILGADEPSAGRSCQTKIPVRTVFIRMSSTMIAIVAGRSMPILHSPVWWFKMAIGLTNCHPMIARKPPVTKIPPKTYSISLVRSTKGARTI